MAPFRSFLGDVAAYACKFTGHRLSRLLHPVIEWGWK